MSGCLALRLRNQSVVVPDWQGIEPCPECVAPTWRRLARKNQDVLILPACVRALGPLMIPATSIEAVVRAGYSASAADATFSLLSPFKGERKDGPT